MMLARLGLVLSALVGPVRAGLAQQAERTTAPPVLMVDTAISGAYRSGWVRRVLLGADYRDLWAARIRLRVLDLAGYAGGLTPISRNGGEEWNALRLQSGDGRQFVFRSLDRNLPAEFRGAVAAAVAQDQASSLHPGANLVVTALQQAAGVLHPSAELMLMPDDGLLGEFREDFAGQVGLLEPRVATALPGERAWAGAREVLESDELFYRVGRSAEDRVDVRALLRARLIDLLVGDWDRNRDQWSWARFSDSLPRVWVPVARNPDNGLVSYDGLLLALGRGAYPQLAPFRGSYPGVYGLSWGGRELDRRWLMELEPGLWESIASDLRATLTDSVIDDAMRSLPLVDFVLDSARTEPRLRQRRDELPRIARQFYRQLAAQAEITATDGDDVALLAAEGDTAVRLTLSPPGVAGRPRPAPYLVRRFDRGDTHELRLFLGGGNDTAIVGGRLDGITVRVVGDSGSDVLLDVARRGWARMYDSDVGTVVSDGITLDRRRYTAPLRRTPSDLPARDWGRRWTGNGTVVGSAPDVGVYLGGGRTLTVYGFRSFPYSSRHSFQAGFATGARALRGEYLGEWRRTNSKRYVQLLARASGIETLSFTGFGNEHPAPPGGPNYYRVTQDQYLVAPSLVAPVGSGLILSGGPFARYVITDRNRGRFIAAADPYGTGDFGQVGLRGSVTWDTRDRLVAPTGGWLLTAGGDASPGWWSVRKGYTRFFAEGSYWRTLQVPLVPTLAVRLGARKNFGPYPYFDAAFIGGTETVRLGRRNRFGGDASVYANSELRLALLRGVLGSSIDLGVFGLADAGRVYWADESSTKWHGVAGGGFWVSVFQPRNTVSVSWARSEQKTAFYLMLGFGIQ